MTRARIIPILLLGGKGLHKTNRFSKGKYLGDAVNIVRLFNDKQCDELVLLDTESSKTSTTLDLGFLKEIASECFMPLAYGGGVRSLRQVEELLKLGMEKVSLNTLYLQEPALVREAIRIFGSSTIVVSIDIKKNLFGQYKVYDHTTGKSLSQDLDLVFEALNLLEPGEVLINCVDLDGTMKGYDLTLARRSSGQLNMPVIYAGGCKDLEDIRVLLTTTQVSGAGVGSYFVFHGPHRAVLVSYPDPHHIGTIYSNGETLA